MPSRLPAICLVSDRRRLTNPSDDALVHLIERAAIAGVTLVQVRERDRDDRVLLRLTERIVTATRATQAKVVVNDRIDVAIAAGCGGVHLRADSMAVDRARAISPPGFLIGRSVHTTEEAVRAAESGADYLVMGTTYPTISKGAHAPLAGIEGLKAVCQAVSTPVLAIGGVTTDKLGSIAAAGAAGVAAIGLFIDVINDDSNGNLDAALGDLVATIRRAFGPHRPVS
jgi:thiamine-phosphate pyrophosphorylase